MRQDQFERLMTLEETLTDVFIAEADSAKWPGSGIEAASMDQQTRGDRYWCKRNAVATISLVQRVGVLIGQVRATGMGTTPTPETAGEDAPQVDHLDDEVKAAEKEAAKLLRDLQTGTSKAKFDKRVHGRSSTSG